MFSATFDADVQRLAQEFLKQQYFFVRVGEINRAVDTVKQTFMLVRFLLSEDGISLPPFQSTIYFIKILYTTYLR